MEIKTIHEIQEEIVGKFARLDGWEAKYRYLIQVGRQSSGIPRAELIDQNLVPGCQDPVWLCAYMEGERMILQGDSVGKVEKGLVTLLVSVYSGHRPEEVLASSPDFIQRIEMDQLIPTSRLSGLEKMVRKIMAHAREHGGNSVVDYK